MKHLSTLILFIVVGTATLAQESSSEMNKTLEEKFSTLKDKAETYNDYKVLKESRLDEFWISVEETLNKSKQDLVEKENTVLTQQDEINRLTTEILSLNENDQQQEYAATHIDFLGIGFSKSTFKITFAIAVLCLLAVLGLGYFQFRHSLNTARKKTADLSKLEEEFEILRKRSLEKQIQLSRDLQTERNLVEELRSKPTSRQRASA